MMLILCNFFSYKYIMKTRKNRINVIKKNYTKKRKKTFNKKHYNSDSGMLTTVWGPSLWHSLHTMSFNYPVNPTNKEKKNYKKFILSLKHVLP